MNNKLLMIDNTWNLVQYLGELGCAVRVVRNDEMTLDALDALVRREGIGHVVISPGPCWPAEAGISLAAVRHFAGKVPLLGVCLGHQSIGEAFGARVVRAAQLMHGKTSTVDTDGRGVFSGLPARFTVNRYHSLAIERTSLPDCLEISACSEDGEIQGLRHKTLPVEGVQFHPESILTEHGHALLKNFIGM